MTSGLRHRALNRTMRVLAVAAATAVTQGCASPGDGAGTTAAIDEGAIVVRDLSGGVADDFAFGKVIGRILASAGVADTPANRTALVRTMLANFTITSANNPVSGLQMAIDKRPLEAGLRAEDLLDSAAADGLIPIGLFNRLDLAPADWSDCGEHRIVYALKPTSPSKRFFLIFEAKLPNPRPNEGMKGCLPVAKRWRDIGAASSAAARRGLLKELYFTGLPGFEPVVHHLNYGGFLGQVRANLFVSNNPATAKWQLREYRILPAAAGTLVFHPGPVASNPLAEFYKDNPAGGAAEQAERTRFHQAFTTAYADALRQFDANAPANLSPAAFRQGLFNCLGAPIQLRDNEFQGDSLGPTDEPAALAGPAFRAAISGTWTSPGGDRKVTGDDLLNRAGVVTCGGCHQFSSDKSLGSASGAAVSWPRPAPGGFFFVHISEETGPDGRHVISDTLKDTFVPHRIKVLKSVLAGESPGQHCALDPAALPLSTAAVGGPTRPQARALAQQVLQGGEGIAGAGALSPAEQMQALSDQAHGADLLKPGAVTPFRRPH